MNYENKNFALVTISYAPDFERCKLLAESVEACMIDDSKHYIIVDKCDVPLFKQLTSSKIKLLIVEEILPAWIFRFPGIRKYWISLRTLPIRNWVLQQLVKMSVFDAISEDVVVFVDSDNVFIRTFKLKHLLVKNSSLALLKVDFENPDIKDWIKASKELLNLNKIDIKPVTYVSNMIAWNRENLLDMRNYIEKTTGKHWIQAVCKYKNISEYMIYGIFVEHVKGLENANHFIFNDELMKPSWGLSLKTKSDFNDFFENLKPSHIGFMVHSKDNIQIDMYKNKIKSFWENEN